MKKIATKIVAVGFCAALCIGSVGAVYAVTGQKDNNQEASAQTVVQSVPEAPVEMAKDETVYVLAGADGNVQKIIVSDWIKNALSDANISDISELTDIENVKGDETYSVNGDNMKVWDAQGNDIYYQGNIEKELPVGMTVSYMLDGQSVSAEEIAGKSGKVTIRFDYENRQYETVTIDGKEEKMYVPFAMITGMLLDSDSFRNIEVTNGRLMNDGDFTAVMGVAFPGLQENLALDKEKAEIPDYIEITADVTNFELGMTVTIATNEVFNEIDTEDLNDIDDLTAAMDDLTDGMEQLMDGSSALYDGLSTLLEKSATLVEGIEQLAEGASALKEGAASLDEGAIKLEAGLETLSSGLGELSANNATLNDGAKTVFETLLATANTQLAEAGITVKELTIENYSEELNNVIASLDEENVYNQALETVTAAVEDKRSYIEEQVTAAVKEQVAAKVTEAVKAQVTSQVTEAVKAEVTTKVTEAVQTEVTAKVTEAVKAQVKEKVIAAATGMSAKDYDAAESAGLVDAKSQSQIEGAVAAQMASEEVAALIATNTQTRMETKEVLDLIASNTNAKMATKDVKKIIKSNTQAQMETDHVKQIIATNIDEQMQSDDITATIAENVEAQVTKAITDNMASDEVQSKLTAASEGAKKIIALKTSLDSYNTFYVGLQTYTAGVASAATGSTELYTGASSLQDGTDKIKTGTSDLNDGVGSLQEGVPALIDGITQLKDGAKELSDGLVKFNEEGIQKLVDAVDGDVEGLIDRLKATVDVSKNYRNFSGISDDMGGQVKFIYRTEEIKAE